MILGLTVAIPCQATGAARWRVEFGATLPANIPAPLRIHQDGHSDLKLTARYASRPFEPPMTWQLRIGRWVAGRGWELDLLHHKLFLENRPPEVQAFGISHGFNLVTLFRGWQWRTSELHAGLGMAIIHPETRVRGQRWDENGGPLGGGYHVGGPTASVAASRPIPLTSGFLLDLEARIAFTYASVPIVDGRADVFSGFVQLAILFGWGRGSQGHTP